MHRLAALPAYLAATYLSYSYQTTITTPNGQKLTTTVNVPNAGGYKYYASSAANLYYLSDSSTNSFNGWHGFQGATGNTAQSYLASNLYICSTNCAQNGGVSASTKGLSITLGGGASLHTGSIPASYANPYSDSGYYLSTPDTSTITMDFGSLSISGSNKCPGCINELAFYWGSIDPGNEISFTDWNGGTPTTFYGADFYNSLGTIGNPLTNPNNLASYGFDFSSTTAWKSVTFSSCDYTYDSVANKFTPDCTRGRAAFEFDNLQWKYPVTCCGPSTGPGGGFAPVPEPAELPVVAFSLVTILGLAKRKFIAAQF